MLSTPIPPPLAPLERERSRLEQRVRLWKIEVALVVEKLLSLGRSYEVRYTLPPATVGTATQTKAPPRELRDFGYDVNALMNSHVFQVKEVCAPHFPQRFIGGKSGGTRGTGKGICSVAIDDYFVGMDVENFLLCPRKLKILRKEVAGVQAAETAVNQSDRRSIVMRFVRLEKSVQVDALQGRSHGRILRTLDEIEAHRQKLAGNYEELIVQDRQIAQRLQAAKKLLQYVKIMSFETQKTLMEDDSFKFARRFQLWYASITKSTPGEDDDESSSGEEKSEDDAATAQMPLPQANEMETDSTSFDHALDVQHTGQDLKGGGHARSTQYGSPAPSLSQQQQQVSHSSAVPFAANAPFDGPVMPPYHIDMSWMDAFSSADVRWLSNAKDTLENLMRAISSSFFESEYPGNSAVPELGCRIGRILFVEYVNKRGTMENSALQKDFKRHARMLRSNLKNPENKQLRSDLLCDALALEKLCRMESEELAPEALRKERQRIRDAYTQSSTIKAPTGKTLVKTKNGFREVNMGGGSDAKETEEPLPTLATINLGGASELSPEFRHAAWNGERALGVPPGESQQSTKGVASSKEIHARNEAEAGVTAEIPHQMVDVKPKPRLTKKRVSFAPDVPLSDEERHEPNTHPRKEQGQRPAPQSTARNSAVEVAEGRAFLLVLLGPTYDIVWSLQAFVTTLQRSSVSEMSQEFDLAPGVKLYRGFSASGSNTYKAWARLAHLCSQSDGHIASEATVHAIAGLIKSVIEWRRLCGEMVSHLSDNIGLSACTDNRQTRDAAFNYLVQKGIAKFSTKVSTQANGNEASNYDVEVSIGGLSLIRKRGPSLPDVRNEAAQALLSFLIDLGSKFEESNKLEREGKNGDANGVHDDAGTQLQQGGREDDNAGESMVSADHQTWARREEKPVVVVSPVNRKRHYASSLGKEEEYTRETVRPRLGYFSQNAGTPAEPERKSVERPTEMAAQVFSVDRVGSPVRSAVRARSKDEDAKAKSEAYQQLLGMMFKNREEAVKMLTSIKWDPSINSETVWLPPSPLPPKFSVRRVVTKQGTGQFNCVITGLEEVVSASGVGASATEATDKAIEQLVAALGSMTMTWRALLSTYLDRRSHTPTSLMAGNEAQAKNRDKVSASEKLVSPLYMYFIFVKGTLVISTACLNARDAKRSANEQFRDILESLLKKEKMSDASHQTMSLSSASHTPSTVSSSTSSTSTRAPPSTAPANQARQPAAIPNLKSRTVVCSDSEDGDDDDYDDYSSGGEYNDEWKASDVPEALNAASTADPIARLVDSEMKEQYDASSESGDTDDARFRAAIRSLFTPADDLCAEIGSQMASLKFCGAGHKTIVPNVKANIRMERLREGIFEVHVDVNGVIAYKATERTKSDAFDAAIRGVLNKLKGIRSLWAQLLHFLDTKSLADVDILKSFNSLKLSGITSITTTVVAPPSVMMLTRGPFSSRSSSGTNCTVRVGDYVVFRVSGETEAEARCLADCKAAKFFSDLIDCGLDPEPFDGEDEKMEVDGGALGQLQDPPPIDWTCFIRIQDRVIATCFYDFPVNAFWCGAPSGITATEFPVARDLSATQRGSVPVETLERELRSNLHESMVAFFRLESAYDQWKFVKQLVRYAEKRRSGSRALALTVEPACPYNMYVIPPGGSINSQDKLYWPSSSLPRHLKGYRTQVIGFLTTKTIPGE